VRFDGEPYFLPLVHQLSLFLHENLPLLTLSGLYSLLTHSLAFSFRQNVQISLSFSSPFPNFFRPLHFTFPAPPYFSSKVIPSLLFRFTSIVLYFLSASFWIWSFIYVIASLIQSSSGSDQLLDFCILLVEFNRMQ